MKIPVIGVVLLSVWCEVASAQSIQPPLPPPPQPLRARMPGFSESAVVKDKEIRIDIPRPSAFERVSDARPQVGYYAWRISVEAPEPFTMVLMADTAMRSSDMRQILRASTLRMCPSSSPPSLLDCKDLIKSKTELNDDQFSLTINDKDFVDRIRRDRPMFYWRGRIYPNGRVQLVQKPWAYQDRKPK